MTNNVEQIFLFVNVMSGDKILYQVDGQRQPIEMFAPITDNAPERYVFCEERDYNTGLLICCRWLKQTRLIGNGRFSYLNVDGKYIGCSDVSRKRQQISVSEILISVDETEAEPFSPSATPRPITVCPQCGKKNIETQNFCDCGKKLHETCPMCWVKKAPYNCGQEKCPGYKVLLKSSGDSKL